MKNIGITILAVTFTALTLSAAHAGQVKSLRGANDLTSPAKMFEKKKILSQDSGFKRAWKLQPPSIPHKIEKDRINLDENTCLRCHSPENYKKERAKKIGDSHFIAADGRKSTKLNARRYFCIQCHTPQKKASPLVENTFSSGGN